MHVPNPLPGDPDQFSAAANHLCIAVNCSIQQLIAAPSVVCNQAGTDTGCFLHSHNACAIIVCAVSTLQTRSMKLPCRQWCLMVPAELRTRMELDSGELRNDSSNLADAPDSCGAARNMWHAGHDNRMQAVLQHAQCASEQMRQQDVPGLLKAVASGHRGALSLVHLVAGLQGTRLGTTLGGMLQQVPADSTQAALPRTQQVQRRMTSGALPAPMPSRRAADKAHQNDARNWDVAHSDSQGWPCAHIDQPLPHELQALGRAVHPEQAYLSCELRPQSSPCNASVASAPSPSGVPC